ncbi:carboxy-cis- cis-muconate cyclase [Apiospora hydei]|uniref:Carboxy-cis- cis-muconate cyclase n=1 Tax=Apiospora hydei TaxID=1337664 RepID=A0ABR1V3I9_9PEZI
MVRFTSFMLNLGLALAAPSLIPRQDKEAVSKKLIVGAAGQILSFQFDGKAFKPISKVVEDGKSASWMVFKHPNHLYAVDENSNTLRLFNYDPATGKLSDKAVSEKTGSPGVVSLEFNKDKTRLLGGSYSNGTVDIWDTSAGDGSMKFLKNVTLQGDVNPKHGTHRAHQIVPDPSGRYFAVNDLGGDAIHILDSQKDYTITSKVKVEPAGCGPRHGGFLNANSRISPSSLPTHYVVLCETMNQLQLYSIEKKADDTLALKRVQSQSSYGPGVTFNTTTAAAGELTVAYNQRDVYITNRLSGNETDNVSLFSFQNKIGKGDGLLFKQQISSEGVSPRMMSLSRDKNESIMFVANPMGKNGIVALKRDESCGLLAPMASMLNADVSPKDGGFGPQFVLEIPATEPSATRQSANKNA